VCACVSVVGVGAELDESSVDDVSRTEVLIISQWRNVSAEEKHQMREQVDKILQPLGFMTSLLAIKHQNSLALFFLCMTLSALTSLRDHWLTGRLRDIVQSLFTLLSGNTRQVRVKRLTWPLADYEQSLEFFNSLQGNIFLAATFL